MDYSDILSILEIYYRTNPTPLTYRLNTDCLIDGSGLNVLLCAVKSELAHSASNSEIFKESFYQLRSPSDLPWLIKT